MKAALKMYFLFLFHLNNKTEHSICQIKEADIRIKIL